MEEVGDDFSDGLLVVDEGFQQSHSIWPETADHTPPRRVR